MCNYIHKAETQCFIDAFSGYSHCSSSSSSLEDQQHLKVSKNINFGPRILSRKAKCMYYNLFTHHMNYKTELHTKVYKTDL